MPFFELPSDTGRASDVIFVRNQDASETPVFTHYAFTIGATSNFNDIQQKRGIPYGSFRDWERFHQKHTDIGDKLISGEQYYPGQSCLESYQSNPSFYYVSTTMRLGALETLANIFFW